GAQVRDIGEKAKAIDLKTFSLSKIRQRYPRAYEKWTDEESTRLTHKYNEGLNIEELAEMFQRQPGAIRSRLQKLRLVK
ncbi:unnamed protein product, partial [marine sediment metagenome]